MAVETGYSKIITRNSVFLYDTGDTVNSYKGEPTTNQFVVYGTSGFGPGADNAVNFPVQGEAGFTRLGFGQTFGGYTIQQNDVVYKYNWNYSPGACHYHGLVQSIPAGAYATFTFEYYISPDTDFSTGNSNFLANFENYGGGALGGSVAMPNYLKGVWQTVSFTSGPRGGGVGSQAMFLYPGGCGGNIATTTGYILYRNPRVYWLPYDVPFVQGTRSTTQAMIDIVGGNTVNLVNMTYGANNALSFDGTDDYMNIASFTAHQKTVGTIAAWAYPNQNTSDSYVMGVGGTTTIGASRAIRVYDGSWGAIGYGNGATEDYNYIVAAPLNTWQYVVYAWNGTTINFYHNGTLYTTTRSGLVTPTGSTLRIGAPPWGLTTYWNGRISMAQVYDRMLSASEVLTNFNHYKTRFNIT